LEVNNETVHRNVCCFEMLFRKSQILEARNFSYLAY